ncbi:hypothetical protein GCM10020331_061180 [Ectobacillus funiculus]
MVQEHNIECDFTEEDAYIYGNTDSSVSKINQEYEAYKKLGIASQYVESIPLPLQVKSGYCHETTGTIPSIKVFFASSASSFCQKNEGMIYEKYNSSKY